MKNLSVILAVWNKKDFIKRAIMPFKDYKDSVELIVIDDNSDDGTSDILGSEEYSWINYERLSERKSTGYCRNLGVSKASGKYIGFLDGDDWVFLDKLLKLVDIGLEEDADIVCGHHIRYDWVSDLIKSDSLGVRVNTFDNYIFELESKESNNLISLFSQVNATCWNKVFKSDFIRNNNLRFTDCCYMEDRAFTQACLIMSSKTLAVNEIVYEYTEPLSNQTSTNTKRNVAKGLWRNYFDYIKYLSDTTKSLDGILDKHRVRDIFNVVITEAVLTASFVKSCIYDEEQIEFDKLYVDLINNLASKVHDRY